MKIDTYGCLCCSGAIAGLYGNNPYIEQVTKKHNAGSSSAFRCVETSDVGRRNFLKGGVALLGTASLLNSDPSVASAQTASTTIFRNGTILTVDQEFSQVEAIAIRGNKILSVGSDLEVSKAAGPDAKIVDLNGRTVLPGFIDPHTHVVSGAIVAATMDHVGVARFSTTDEVLSYLKKLTLERAPGEWISVRNWDPSIQEGPDALTIKELDEVSTEHPVFVMNASGHLAYANSMALKLANVPADIENPPGAEYVRDANGVLNGVMKNLSAFLVVAQANPAMQTVEPANAILSLISKWNAVGLTMCSDLGLGALTSSAADVDILWQTAKTGQLTGRIRAYPFYPFEKEWLQAGVKPGDGDEMVRLSGYKLVADGSNQGFTGLQREPYLGTDNTGIAYNSPEKLKRLALERSAEGWQLAIHGNGDKGIDNALDAIEAVKDAGHDLKKLRPRIEHCSILHDGQIARMKELNVSASFLIGHVYYWGVAMRDTVFGEEKAKLLDRCRSVELAGVGFSLHSDFMVVDPDPLHMIEMAVTRRAWKEPDYILAPDERISVSSAIRAVTSEAAWQLGSEHEVGSLEQGKFADMVILEKDPRSVDPDTIKDIKVMETWMNGKQVFKA